MNEERLKQMLALLVEIKSDLTIAATQEQAFHCRVQGRTDYVQFEVMTTDRMNMLAHLTVESYYQDRKLTLRINVTATVCHALPEARVVSKALALAMDLAEQIDATYCQPWNQS